MQAAWEQKVRILQFSGFDPGFVALTGLFRDLELDRSLGLLLHDCGPRSHVTSATDVLHLQSHKIPRSKLAINCKIEHRELTSVRRHLKPCPDRPDFSEL
jgi:hypothetical protein